MKLLEDFYDMFLSIVVNADAVITCRIPVFYSTDELSKFIVVFKKSFYQPKLRKLYL